MPPPDAAPLDALPPAELRGLLYAVWDEPAWLIGVQLLDGVGAGLIGALFPVVFADLTRGSGRFATVQGAVGTVHAVGGIASGALSGLIVVQAGYDAAFLALAAAAAVVFEDEGSARGAFGGIGLVVLPHAAWQVARLQRHLGRGRPPGRIDGLMALSLSYVVWFVAFPLWHLAGGAGRW